MSNTSETPRQIIEGRIQKHLDEIESFEMNDTSFVNSKRIKEINGFVMELKAVLNILPTSEPIAEQDSKNPNPYKEQIIKLALRQQALQNAINNFLLLSGFDETTAQLIEIRDEIKQQINDLQVDANALPFPEK